MSLEQTTRTLVTFTQAKNNPRRITNIGLTQQRMRTVCRYPQYSEHVGQSRLSVIEHVWD